MNTQTSAPALWTVEQAAAYCGIAVSTMNKLRCHGGGPAYYAPTRRIGYSQLDLDSWIASTRRMSTSELLAA